jgi:peptide/nickel transport system permease protein
VSSLFVKRYLAGRIGQAVLVVWVVYTVTFVVLNLLPSNALQIHLGVSTPIASLTPKELEQLKVEYGLNHSLMYQYFHQLWEALHFNFGQSVSLNLPVSTAIKEHVATTAKLSGMAIVMMIMLGIGLAYLSMLARWRWLKAILVRLPALAVSVPGYLVGLVLIELLSFKVHWFPSTGTGGLNSYILPAFTMALPTGAVLAQVLIAGFEKTLREPYIYTARAKGLTRAQIQWRHVTRNAALPTLTVLGLLVATSVMGAVIAETVFSMNGLGRLAEQAVLAQDVPLVQALALIAATAFVVVNLIVDLSYPLFDPRITHTPNVVSR